MESEGVSLTLCFEQINVVASHKKLREDRRSWMESVMSCERAEKWETWKAQTNEGLVWAVLRGESGRFSGEKTK